MIVTEKNTFKIGYMGSNFLSNQQLIPILLPEMSATISKVPCSVYIFFKNTHKVEFSRVLSGLLPSMLIK